jgi:hypothetical protein
MPAKVETKPVEPASFVACEKFDGPREGYEFKTGSDGVGYYRAGTGPEEKASGDEPDGGEASLAPAPASGWRDPDDEGFDIESVPALTPEEIKASEDEELERVTRISAVRRQPGTASCSWPLFRRSAFDRCVSATGHDERSWRARCRSQRSFAQYSSSSTQIRMGG